MNQGNKHPGIPASLFKEHVCECGSKHFFQAMTLQVYEGVLSPMPVINGNPAPICVRCLLPLRLEKPSPGLTIN